VSKPESIENLTSEQVAEMFQWLDDLRDSGTINMFAARIPLAGAFGLDTRTARQVHGRWMETFALRHGLPGQAAL
jgi:hypothetical protein